MVSKTGLVKVNGVVIMNDVGNIWNSRTVFGWGVLMDGNNRNVLSSVRGMTRYGKTVLRG